MIRLKKEFFEAHGRAQIASVPTHTPPTKKIVVVKPNRNYK
tara:strand:- start:496 stop:618 length:123 start_codon:yes stop_codon:yes gene_type:complete